MRCWEIKGEIEEVKRSVSGYAPRRQQFTVQLKVFARFQAEAKCNAVDVKRENVAGGSQGLQRRRTVVPALFAPSSY